MVVEVQIKRYQQLIEAKHVARNLMSFIEEAGVKPEEAPDDILTAYRYIKRLKKVVNRLENYG